MIAREGLIPISAAFLAAVAVAHYVGLAWSLPLWALGAYGLYLFRETIPAIPNQPLAVLSPADGRVVDIGQQPDAWLDRDALRVRVDLVGPGIGVLRSAVEGKVMDYWTSSRPFNQPGSARDSGFSPNCYSVWVQTDEGDDVVFAVSSLRPISRFKLNFSPGERVGIGQRIGFVYFGSVVDVFMPVHTRLQIDEGSAVEAGGTVLGQLVRQPATPANVPQAS